MSFAWYLATIWPIWAFFIPPRTRIRFSKEIIGRSSPGFLLEPPIPLYRCVQIEPLIRSWWRCHCKSDIIITFAAKLMVKPIKNGIFRRLRFQGRELHVILADYRLVVIALRNLSISANSAVPGLAVPASHMLRIVPEVPISNAI
jgi:hypothetical protein